MVHQFGLQTSSLSTLQLCPSPTMLVVYTFCVSHSDHTLQGILCLPYITYRDNMTLW